jgi:hypothetical protein
MALQYQDVEAISKEVVRDYPREPQLNFVSVMSTDGGGERVEVMVTVAGCHKQPCMLVLNLSRRDRNALTGDLRQKLQEALQSHLAPTV